MAVFDGKSKTLPALENTWDSDGSHLGNVPESARRKLETESRSLDSTKLVDCGRISHDVPVQADS